MEVNMRHSPLLRTHPANFAFILIAVGVCAWTAVSFATKLTGAETLRVMSQVYNALLDPRSNSGLAVAIVAGVVMCMIVGPALIRLVLSKRAFVAAAVLAMAFLDPLLAVAAVAAVLSAFAFVRFCYGGVGASISSLFDFSAIAWPLRILYTFAGAVLVLAILTMPRLPIDASSFLPWPIFSVYGVLVAFFGLFVSGYLVGNLYFPLIEGSKWAWLAFIASLIALNPVIGAICSALMIVFFVLISFGKNKRTWVGGANNVNRYFTAGTPESEAIGIFHEQGRK